MTGMAPGIILKKVAGLLCGRNDELAKLEVLDTGKSIQEAGTVDIFSGAETMQDLIVVLIGGEKIDCGTLTVAETGIQPPYQFHV